MSYHRQSSFGDAASDAANAAIVTVGPDGVKTLVPAAGMLLMQKLRTVGSSTPPGQSYIGAAVMTTAPDKEMVLAQNATAGMVPIDTWVNNQLALGRSVSISTNTAGGIASLLGSGGDFRTNVGGAGSAQLVFTAVSTKADEIAAAGPAMSEAALIAPSTLPAGGPGAAAISKAGMAAPVLVAALALLVVGGAYYASRRKKAH